MTRIYLIGYMGAGKTTLGRSLARSMSLSYFDTDNFIEARYHKKVSEIFASESEQRFREIEHRALLEISEFEDIVVSTGGGLPCYFDNMQIMNSSGITVWLAVDTEILAARLEASKTVRPVLRNRTGAALREFIEENLAARRPYYEQANIHFDASPMKTDSETSQLTDELKQLIINYIK